MKPISRRQLFQGLAATSIAGVCGYKPYTDEEKNIIIEYFNNFIKKIEYEKTRIIYLYGKVGSRDIVGPSKLLNLDIIDNLIGIRNSNEPAPLVFVSHSTSLTT